MLKQQNIPKTKVTKVSTKKAQELTHYNFSFKLDRHMTKLHKQVGPWCLVCGLQLPGRWPNLLEHQWELDFGVVELFCAVSLAKLSWDSCSLDDLDARKPDSVARSHLGVHLFHSTIKGGVTVFLVHVVITSSALVTQPNTIVLDCCGVFLKNLQ